VTALDVILIIGVVVGQVMVARARRPLAPPFWQNASFTSDSLEVHQDPRRGTWIVVDNRDGEVLGRDRYRGRAYLQAVDNLKRRERGRQIRRELIP
jgi:hypothetical protein